MAKRPTVSDQAAVAVSQEAGPLVQAVTGDELFVKFLAALCRRRTARRSDIDSRHVKAGGQHLFNIVAMRHIAKAVIDPKPKGAFQQPAFLRVDSAGGL